ncbi:MAG: LLM class flavin-dependent oxidoreductase [Alphaproteobacteria bacterium]
MQFVLLSLGDHLPDPHTGRHELDQAGRHRQIVELGVSAEQWGFDAVWLGEHHFSDYILTVPQIALAAIGERTKRIRLGTGLTLLPHHDAVRIAEDIATLDCLTGGRAEVCVGVGIDPHCYDHFGQDIAESKAMLEEKVELMRRLWTEQNLNWSGKYRAPLSGVTLTPKPVQRNPHPPIWYGGGSSEESVDRAARLGLPILLPGIFLPPERFVPFAKLYREKWRAYGRPPELARVGTVTHAHIRDDGTDIQAYWAPYFDAYHGWLCRMTGREGPPDGFRISRRGPLIFGTPAEAAARIGEYREMLGLDLLICAFDSAGLPAAVAQRSAKLFGTQVIPAVRAAERPVPARVAVN